MHCQAHVDPRCGVVSCLLAAQVTVSFASDYIQRNLRKNRHLLGGPNLFPSYRGRGEAMRTGQQTCVRLPSPSNSQNVLLRFFVFRRIGGGQNTP